MAVDSGVAVSLVADRHDAASVDFNPLFLRRLHRIALQCLAESPWLHRRAPGRTGSSRPRRNRESSKPCRRLRLGVGFESITSPVVGRRCPRRPRAFQVSDFDFDFK